MILGALDELDIAMAAITSAMTLAIVWIIAYQWRKTRVAAYDARLKQLMIERGMSASDIERVLRAGSPSDAAKGPQGHSAIGIGGMLDTDCCADDASMKSG